jgi:sulfatase modifying factor 1
MRFMHLRALLLVTLLTFAMTSQLASAGDPELVSVGNAGNKADSTSFGAVSYEYRIGKYEVTNEQLCGFLNAAARANTLKLYDPRMAGEYGGITRSGDSGSYTYAVKEGMGKKPVNFVTWETAVRYANWLTNGGAKGDTETGSYTIKDGKVTVPDHAALAAGKTTKWVLPSENEWYKAAYYDPRKAGGGGYWLYPARSDDVPAANLNSNAPTEVGSYAKAVSPYGTYDQGGNMWEYNDTRKGNKVGLRGGSFWINDNANYLRSTTRYDVLSAKWPNYGFRVVALGGPAPK